MYYKIAKSFASYIISKNQFWIKNPIQAQSKTFEYLINNGQKTLFGQQYFLKEIRSYEEFKQSIPVSDYEKFKIYIDRIIMGESDVIWPGKPIYFSKTSGTTSGVKNLSLIHI